MNNVTFIHIYFRKKKFSNNYVNHTLTKIRLNN